MADTDYANWTIRAGFLDGNLGDIDPDDYEERLQEELGALFPGAEIDTPHQRNAEGCVPLPLQPCAIRPDGSEDQTALRKIESVMESCYAQCCESNCASTDE